MDVKTVAEFVSFKINKIRWKPAPKQSIQQTKVFATGSWDNDVNNVCLWSVDDDDYNQSMDDNYSTFFEGKPKLLCTTDHPGDVTDLIYLNNDLLLVSSSLGSVTLYKHHTNSQTVSTSHTWKRLHTFPCTALAVSGEDTFVTVGEDGKMNIMKVTEARPIRTIEKADSCPLNAVCFLKQLEVAAVNATGQMKIWDLRQPNHEPCRVINPTNDRIGLNCIDKHPTQPHIVATGGQDGAVSIWDMREERFPMRVLGVHSAAVWEVKFHPTHPNNLFSCSEEGSLWHWDGNSIKSEVVSVTSSASKDISKMVNASLTTSLTTPVATLNKTICTTSPWLACEAKNDKMEITNLLPGNKLPVNSLDINNTTILCGTDNEQIITIKNMVVR